MIVSWNWLKEYVRLDTSLETLVERLRMAGLNLEGTEEVEGDLAVDLEVTSNRPDCLGQIGVAREVAALFGHELMIPPADVPEAGPASAELTSITLELGAADWCPQYRARVIQNVRIGPSPDWMQRRLRAVGLTPINNVVDVTNYVLMECGQPLHAFDQERLREGRIVVRAARAGERFLAINNREYPLEPWMGVIADAQRAVAIAGVMGGLETEVTSQTRTVLLESAQFSPLAVRRTSRALDLSSESSYRFERKVDPAGIAWASDRACHLICRLTGGTVARQAIHVGRTRHQRAPIRLRWSRVPRILGIDLPRPSMCRILTRLGMEVAEDEEGANVTPPTFRGDLAREIDLVEELGRIHGYQAVPEDRAIPLIAAARSKQDRILDRVRETLAGLGYCEAVTWSFTDRRALETARPWSSDPPLAVRHSSRRHENLLRQSLVPSLLAALRWNESRGNADADLFEIALIFLPAAGGGLPAEPTAIGLVSTRDIRSVRGHLDFLMLRLHLELDLVPGSVAGLDPARSAALFIDGERVGVLGHADQATREFFDLGADPVVAELLLAPLVARAQNISRVRPLPDQPAIVRDLNFVIEEQVRWAQLAEVCRAAAGPLLETLDFVDLYRGSQVPQSKKSITLRLTYRASGRTLAGPEVDVQQAEVIAAVRDRLGGELRGT